MIFIRLVLDIANYGTDEDIADQQVCLSMGKQGSQHPGWCYMGAADC